MKTPRELLQAALIAHPDEMRKAFTGFCQAAMCAGEFYTTVLPFGITGRDVNPIELASKLVTHQLIAIRAVKNTPTFFKESSGSYDSAGWRGEVIIFGDSPTNPYDFYAASVSRDAVGGLIVRAISSNKDDILILKSLIAVEKKSTAN